MLKKKCKWVPNKQVVNKLTQKYFRDRLHEGKECVVSFFLIRDDERGKWIGILFIQKFWQALSDITKHQFDFRTD